MSLILLPVGVVGELLGFSGGDGMELFASVEGALVGNVATALDGGKEEGAVDVGSDDDARAKVVAVLTAAASAQKAKANPSKVTVKRLKRTAFLARVRGTAPDFDEPNVTTVPSVSSMPPPAADDSTPESNSIQMRREQREAGVDLPVPQAEVLRTPPSLCATPLPPAPLPPPMPQSMTRLAGYSPRVSSQPTTSSETAQVLRSGCGSAKLVPQRM